MRGDAETATTEWPRWRLRLGARVNDLAHLVGTSTDAGLRTRLCMWLATRGVDLAVGPGRKNGSS